MPTCGQCEKFNWCNSMSSNTLEKDDNACKDFALPEKEQKDAKNI